MRAVAEGEDAVYACVRAYRNVRSPGEVARRVEEGFRPVLEAMPGFAGYRVDAAASAEREAEWVRENLADLHDGGPPEVALDEVMPAIAS